MSEEKKAGSGGEQAKEIKVQPASAADELGRLNPSSPGQTGTTPGSNVPAVEGSDAKG